MSVQQQLSDDLMMPSSSPSSLSAASSLWSPSSLSSASPSGPGLRWRIDRGVLQVVGEVDLTSEESFATALSVCHDDTTVAALDLSGVSFFSAAGVRCFVRQGWTTAAHPMIIASPAVRRVLTICEVEFLLERHGWAGGSVCPTRAA